MYANNFWLIENKKGNESVILSPLEKTIEFSGFEIDMTIRTDCDDCYASSSDKNDFCSDNIGF